MPKKQQNPMTELYKEQMTSQEEIVTAAITRVISKRSGVPQTIKTSFSEYVQDIEKTAYEIFLEGQGKAGCSAIKSFIEERTTETSTRDDILNVFTDSFNILDRFFLSLGQARKARAGSTFEHIIRHLFKKLEYPFEEQQIINGRPDFLLPNREHYDRNPMDCIIFTAKRTLRERWRQIVTEGTRGLGFFLATIDEKVSENQLCEMLNHRIYLVVPAKILDQNDIYKFSENVMSFETFFLNHLDPAMVRWRKRNL